MSYVFVCCDGAAIKHKNLFSTRNTATETHKTAETIMETKLHFISVYASVLKDSERGERTSKVVHGLGGCQLLKVREQLRSSCIDSQTRSNDP